jgi:protein-disulfide isomerase
MRSLSSYPVLISLSTLLCCACGEHTASAREQEALAQPNATTGDDTIVASIAGDAISLAEVDAAASGELQALQQKIYEVRRGALDTLIAEALMEREAERRGIPVADLRRIEVTDKIEEVTPAAVDALYQQVKSRLGGSTKEQVLPQLHMEVRRINAARRDQAFRDDLARAAEVRMMLPPPRIDVTLNADAPTLGPSDAPVTIVAFSDYQCPYCHRAQATVERLLERYEGKLRLVHGDFPLANHAGAIPAARAARCAGEQGKFWEYHRILLSETGEYSDQDLQQRAAKLDLDAEPFAQCLASGRHAESIEASFDEARKLGVAATPTFFINGRRLEGARSIEDFAAVIDEELALAGA